MSSKAQSSNIGGTLSWTHVSSWFFGSLLILASLFAIAGTHTPESAIIILAVVIPIGWLVLRDSRFPNKLWGTGLALPVILWIIFGVIA